MDLCCWKNPNRKPCVYNPWFNSWIIEMVHSPENMDTCVSYMYIYIYIHFMYVYVCIYIYEWIYIYILIYINVFIEYSCVLDMFDPHVYIPSANINFTVLGWWVLQLPLLQLTAIYEDWKTTVLWKCAILRVRFMWGNSK